MVAMITVCTNLARVRTRAPRGYRVIVTVLLGTWETITFVAGLRHNRITTPMVVEDTMTGASYRAVLSSRARRNDIMVMNNCRIHMGLPFARRSRKRTRDAALPAEILAGEAVRTSNERGTPPQISTRQTMVNLVLQMRLHLRT